MLPGIDGWDACKFLKSDPKTESIPIIMLSAKSDESDIILGLELGADDYMTKPFNAKVLVARVRRLINRNREKYLDRNHIKIHDLVIDPAPCEAFLGETRLTLTFSEFNILCTLAQRPGIVFTRYQIVDALHGSKYVVSDRAIDVQIAYLRKKLGSRKDYIETVRGVGYRFKEEASYAGRA